MICVFLSLLFLIYNFLPQSGQVHIPSIMGVS